jgi:hypothetical protein
MNDDHPQVSALLRELTADIQEALGPDVLGLYVTGSYVGGFDPEVSDLDLIAVTRVDAAELDLERLRAMHAAFVRRHPDWADRIEVVYIGADAVASFRTSRGAIAVISPGEPFHLRPEPPAEWVQNWYGVRESGVTLFGPPPTALIPPVEWGEFAEACRRYVAELADRDLDGSSASALAYTLLTVCRAEEAVIGGRAVSKREGAAIAQRRHPEAADVIEAALECRQKRGVGCIDDEPARTAAIDFIRSVAASLSEHGKIAP